MAEVLATMVVGPLVSMVKEKASSYLLDQYKVMEGMEEQHKLLKRKLPAVLDVITDAEEQAAKNREGAKAWLEELRMVAYKANDVLDEFKYEALRRKAKAEGHYKEFGMDVIKLFPSHNRFVFRYRMANKLRMILQEIDVLIVEMNTFRFKFKPQPPMSLKWRETDPNIPDHYVNIASASRANEKEEIVEALLGQRDNVGLTVLPVVGMGGMGKTTLAQLVYNDSSIQKHFQVQIWVCVSENFDVDSLFETIVKEAEKNGCQMTGCSTVEKFKGAMSGKKYLLVLDDVWNREAYKWDKLRSYLHHGAPGSSVLTTTRDEIIAQFMKTIEAHKIKPLKESYIEEIIKKEAFSVQAQKAELLNMVGAVAKRCSGSPLAATAMGSVLRTKNTLQEWEAVLNRSTICDEENGILPILKLSYNCLPSHMRQCFAFCAIFPKDHKIDVGMLIQLWMANSFIPEQLGVCPEVTGKQIFNELAQRSFFQEVQQDKFCRPITCKIHDLMHDVAQDSMGKECVAICTKLSKSEDFPYTARHLFMSVDIPEKDLNPSSEKKSPAIQTLICERFIEDDLQTCDGSTKDYLQHLLPQCRSVRALKTRLGSSPSFDAGDPDLVPFAGDPHLVPGTGSARQKRGFCFIRHIFGEKQQRREIETAATHLAQAQLRRGARRRVPNGLSVLEPKYLHHLRYLDLSKSDMEALPEEITILYHLQTLNLSDCGSLKQLPMAMKYMTALRHLYTHGCPKLKSMPPDLGHLTSLQMLTCFVAGSIGLGCSNLGELETLDLGGQLELSHLENVTGVDAKEANLRNKRKLEELKLSWDSAIDHDTEAHKVAQHKEVLEGLKPHDGLKALKMDYYQGRAFPTWMLELQGMIELKLCNCKNLETLPALWKLPALQFLILDNLENLHCLFSGGAPSKFQKLESMVLERMPEFVRWWDTNEVQEPIFPMVEYLMISGCKRLTALPKASVIKPSSIRDDTDCCHSAFPALRKIDLYCLDMFQRWEAVEGEQATFPSLEELKINDCPVLIAFPEAPKLSTVRLWNCSELVVRGHDSPMEVLTCLEICQCDDLVSWPEILFRGMVSLRTLKIKWCNRLAGVTKEKASNHQSAPEQSGGLLLPCLESLEIVCCGSLEQVPNLWAPRLKTLCIHTCSGLRSMVFGQQEDCKRLASGEGVAQPADTSSSLIVPVSTSADNHYCFFPCLESLTISCCDGLTEVANLPPSIKTLKISLSDSLVSLTGEVRSLEQLEIYNCKSLQALPNGPYSSLKVLPIQYCDSIIELLPGKLQGCLDHLDDKELDSSPLQEQVELDSKLKSKSDGTSTAVVLLKSSSTSSNHCLFPCLESLTIYWCHGLTKVANLPPSIKTLTLSSCRKLESLSAEVPLLEELRIGYCDKLEFLSNGPDHQVYSSLRIFSIDSCRGINQFLPSLKQRLDHLEEKDLDPHLIQEQVELDSKPEFMSDGASTSVVLKQSSSTSSSSYHSIFPCLESLVIKFCNELTEVANLPPCLESLAIKFCYELTKVANLPPSIKTVEISNCDRLVSLSGELPFLEELDISDCKSVESLLNGPHQVYSSLRVLKIKDCCGIKQLPPSLQKSLDQLKEKALDPHLLQGSCYQTLQKIGLSCCSRKCIAYPF